MPLMQIRDIQLIGQVLVLVAVDATVLSIRSLFDPAVLVVIRDIPQVRTVHPIYIILLIKRVHNTL